MTRSGTKGLLAVGTLSLIPMGALACSLALDRPGPELPTGETAPTNAVFLTDRAAAGWTADGLALELREDPALSALLGETVARPDAPLAPGATLARPCGSIDATCASAMVGSGADELPPRRPALTLAVTLVDGGSDGGGFSCAEPDILTLRVRDIDDAPLDDTTHDEALTVLAYVGATADEAATATVTAATLGDDDWTLPGTDTAVYLGQAGAREGASPFARETVCVAVALMDMAGNVGERSEPVCVDTLDREAPTTTVIAGRGCSAAPGVGSNHAGGWLLAVAMLLLRRWRRRA